MTSHAVRRRALSLVASSATVHLLLHHGSLPGSYFHVLLPTLLVWNFIMPERHLKNYVVLKTGRCDGKTCSSEMHKFGAQAEMIWLILKDLTNCIQWIQAHIKAYVVKKTYRQNFSLGKMFISLFAGNDRVLFVGISTRSQGSCGEPASSITEGSERSSR